MKFKKLVYGVLLTAFTTVCFLQNTTVPVFAAAKNITVDEEAYNLVIDDSPSDVDSSALYAKLTNTKVDVEQYSLSMFDDYESAELFADALKKSNDSIDNYESYAMDIQLYEMDEEGEYYPASPAYAVDLICPVPYTFEGLEESVKLLRINKSSGKVETVSTTLVSVDGTLCLQFQADKFTQYAFAVDKKTYDKYINGEDEPIEEEEEEISEPTKTPTKTPTKEPTKTPTKAPTKTPTKEPTKTPTKTPTKAPTKTPTKAPVKESAATPTKTPQKQTAVPTKSPASASNIKDKTPQTGDDFNGETTIKVTLGAGVLLMAAVWYVKKK